MTFVYRDWHRGYMKRKRTPLQEHKRVQRLKKEGKCLRCEMLLKSPMHTDCPQKSVAQDNGQLLGNNQT